MPYTKLFVMLNPSNYAIIIKHIPQINNTAISNFFILIKLKELENYLRRSNEFTYRIYA
ncbi:hypothetical protein ACRAD_28760 (plasmid) [Acinetobacter radioresistens DSM 6976 = NBRC 102413 = CIP 103788]|nr:hypothetical protein ACRAD_28760 [Acinetobacter radioresistens DSM 6976 = NBRC 102413 = CIP 103788]